MKVLKTESEKEKIIIELICNCIRCAHIRLQTKRELNTMSFEEMFDELEKREKK